MNVQIEQLLRRRADRADNQPDTEQVLASVRELVDRRRRRRRSLAAAGSGAAVVAGVVALVAVVTPGTGGSSGGRQAGGNIFAQPGSTTRSSAPSTPSASQTRSSSAALATTDRPAISSTTHSATSSVPTGGRLVDAGVTPKRAALAVSLVPMGWKYVSSAGPVTAYGPAGTNSDPTDFRGKLILDVAEAYGSDPMPLTLAGRTASVTQATDDDTVWMVAIRYSSKISLDIQVPGVARLDRDQVIRLANTLQVRDVSVMSHG